MMYVAKDLQLLGVSSPRLQEHRESTALPVLVASSLVQGSSLVAFVCTRLTHEAPRFCTCAANRSTSKQGGPEWANVRRQKMSKFLFERLRLCGQRTRGESLHPP